MKFDELYKKVIDSCKAFEERQVPISLDFKIEDLRDALVESNDTIEKLKAKLAEKDKEIAELKSMNESLYLRADNWKALCLASENAYKKLVKKFVHETSVAESYRSIIFKDDALNALEKDDVVSYNLLSKKSDNCYRHANRWRGIFKKLNEDM